MIAKFTKLKIITGNYLICQGVFIVLKLEVLNSLKIV